VPELAFRIDGAERAVRIDRLIIAGWTGRDRAAVEHHIAELGALGVKPPRAAPCFYGLGANLLTTAAEVEVVGTDSSGEVEFVLVSTRDGVCVGVGSDHTDRKVEAYGVTVSKQMCPKPIGAELWRLADVGAHWDRLELRSHVVRGGKRVLYQEGAVSKMLSPADLLARLPGAAGALPPGAAMFCGTLAVQGAIGGGDSFEIELADPVKRRRLRHAYTVRCLEIAD
jgi:Protein of unknown function (DUF2848)